MDSFRISSMIEAVISVHIVIPFEAVIHVKIVSEEGIHVHAVVAVQAVTRVPVIKN